MDLSKHKIPFFVCLSFIISSPIIQIIGSYAGGYLIYLVSPNDYNSDYLAAPLMFILSMSSLIAFLYFKTKTSKLITSILVTFFTCNVIVFSGLKLGDSDFYTYPGIYIFGSIVSFILMFAVFEIREVLLRRSC